MDRRAPTERRELAAGLEDEGEREVVGPPAQPLHPPEVTEHVVQETQMDAPPDEHVPPVDRVGAGRDPLEQGERAGRGAAGDVGADDAGREVAGQALHEGLLVEQLGSGQGSALLQRRGRDRGRSGGGGGGGR